MISTATYLQQLVQKTHKSEAEVIALAVQAGLRQLWREDVLGRYWRGSITRQEAIDALGVDLVALSERQQQAVQEDMEWATP
jgi:hypothetical protein